jgi:CRP-like cAMP-binding protein
MNSQLTSPESITTAQTAADPRLLEAQVAAHPFVKGMNPDHLELLAANALPVRFEANHLIFSEGDVANRFFLIQEGRVALESFVRGRGTLLIATIGGGEALGWSWLFAPGYWHFDARAIEPVKAIALYGPALRQLCETDHDFGYELIKRVSGVLIHRLQDTRRQLLDIYDMRA